MAFIQSSNLTTWYNTLNNIRSKHGLSTISVPTINGQISFNQMDTFISQLNNLKGNEYLNYATYSDLSEVQKGALIKQESADDINNTLTSLKTICTNNANTESCSTNSTYTQTGASNTTKSTNTTNKTCNDTDTCSTNKTCNTYSTNGNYAVCNTDYTYSNSCSQWMTTTNSTHSNTPCSTDKTNTTTSYYYTNLGCSTNKTNSVKATTTTCNTNGTNSINADKNVIGNTVYTL